MFRSLAEDNPVQMVLTTSDLGALGALSLHSAQSFDTTSGRVLLTYWRVRLSGTTLSAELTDPHLSEAAALNVFNGQRLLVPCRPEMGSLPPWPIPLDVGSALTGTIADGRVRLQLTSVSTDQLLDLDLSFASD
ncbi:hypothetical protein [Mangrovihabitans endophyticus]|uniref:Uncharacterized protein n=1 Tax=Mangrovihabitans endophyticus TaxID=1751298 RepID=A0A8J3BYT4_9ACTN|nr:hypothetical protein [Mangrovihabitans endophyticus]GGK81761.1 hypothetical protein GCM10012284_14760 [Mangrovihabitans endophyticus]